MFAPRRRCCVVELGLRAPKMRCSSQYERHCFQTGKLRPEFPHQIYRTGWDRPAGYSDNRTKRQPNAGIHKTEVQGLNSRLRLVWNVWKLKAKGHLAPDGALLRLLAWFYKYYAPNGAKSRAVSLDQWFHSDRQTLRAQSNQLCAPGEVSSPSLTLG